MKALKIFLAAILICSFASCSCAESVRLGIMRFDSKTYDVPDRQAAAISDFFARMLFKADGIRLLERERLDDVMHELQLGMSGYVDERTAAEVGRLAGCEYMLMGSITNLARGSSGVGLPGFGVPLLGGLGVRSEKAKATLDVRVVSVETGEIVFADSAEGTATKSDTAIYIHGMSVSNEEFGGLEGNAIAKAVAVLAPRIQKALTGRDTLTALLQAEAKGAKKTKGKSSSGVSASSAVVKRPLKTQTQTPALAPEPEPAPARTASANFENRSTDPAKVIASYGLPSGEANTLRIKHINLKKQGNKMRTFQEYVKMYEETNGVDYLAAFRAGEVALGLKDKDSAREWFENALATNPNYEPAQRALRKLR